WARPGFVIYDYQKTLYVTPDEDTVRRLEETRAKEQASTKIRPGASPPRVDSRSKRSREKALASGQKPVKRSPETVEPEGGRRIPGNRVRALAKFPASADAFRGTVCRSYALNRSSAPS